MTSIDIAQGMHVRYTQEFCEITGSVALAARVGVVVGRASFEAVYVTWADDLNSVAEPCPVLCKYLCPAT